jgi:hypothetical protein
MTGPVRSARHLGTAVVVLLGSQIGLLLFRGIAFVMRIDLLQRIQSGDLVTRSEAEASDRLVGVSAILWLLAFIATGIVWLIWQHHAHANARAITDGGTSISPGWAVGWWFIPFANLGKPFVAVRELWRASAGGDRWQEQRWAVLGWWWAAWLAFNLVDVFTVTRDDATIESLQTADRTRLASTVFGIAAACLAIVVVRSIGTRQDAAIAVTPLMPPAPTPIPPAPRPVPPPPQI